ncbi:hypothetical protein K435DRAFT_617308, partial [Dendrothele bispora CBS 962.96]
NLCPYCDRKMPENPSTKLQQLLKHLEKKSTFAPRPSNSYGRKASLADFSLVCQQHVLETDMLSKAILEGWPLSVDFDGLATRVRQMKNDLKAILQDETARNSSFLWREVLVQINEHGMESIKGFAGRYELFHMVQPGYYGERGLAVIMEVLYSPLPSSLIEKHLDNIAPLDPQSFFKWVLAPEVALRLITTDRNLSGASGMQEGLKVMRASSSYGAAMFPDEYEDCDG